MEQQCSYYVKTLEELVEIVGAEKEPERFRNEFFAIMQLYYDGLVEKRNPEGIGTQKNIFEGLCEAGKSLENSLYCRKPEFGMPREYVLRNRKNIVAFGSERQAKERHLEKKQDYLFRFGKQCSLFWNYDIIAGASSGSFEPALLAASILEKPYFFVRYSYLNAGDFYVHLPPHEKKRELAKNVAKKRVLFVDDTLFTGRTAYIMHEFIAPMRPKEFLCTAVYMLGGDSDRLSNIDVITYDDPCIFEVK